MAKVVLFAIVCLGILIPSAHAVDWKLNATQSETVELSDNRLMLPQPKGASYNTISSLLFNARALNPTSSLTLNGSLDYRTFGGPGEANEINTLNNSVDAKFEKVYRQTIYNLIGSRAERNTSTIQLLETGQATVTGTTVITAGGGGFRKQLGPRDTLSSQTALTQTETTRSGAATAVPRSRFDSLVSTLDWRHQSTAVTNWIPSLQYQKLNFSGPLPSQIEFWRATTGIDTDLTGLLHLKTSAGATLLNGGQTAQTVLGPALTTATQFSSNLAIDWIADMTLSYKYRYGTMSFTAAQTNGPTTLGQFVKSQTVGIAASYSINRASTLGAGVSFSHQISTTPSDFVTASATYTYLLMHDLHAQLTYRFSQRTSTSSTVTAVGAAPTLTSTSAQSNTMLLVLRREVTVLP